MNNHLWKGSSAVLLVFSIAVDSLAAVASDIGNMTGRREILASARLLVEPSPKASLSPDIVNVFNPAAFSKPDAEELAAIAAAQAAEAAASAKARPASDADLLGYIAERVVPSGTLTLNKEPLLIFGQKKLRVGDRLTVTYDGRDYNLELINIERFTFTLRLNRAEITRRINP
jgi:hypothetical protein